MVKQFFYDFWSSYIYRELDLETNSFRGYDCSVVFPARPIACMFSLIVASCWSSTRVVVSVVSAVVFAATSRWNFKLGWKALLVTHGHG